MQERLKEIVIYILENGSGLEPEQREELRRVWDELNLGSFPIEEIEAALSRALEAGLLQDQDGELFELLPGQQKKASAAEPLADLYLDRLESAGLIDAEQRSEILLRAGRLETGGSSLEEIQFVAASIIFDETLGMTLGWSGIAADPTASVH